MYLINRKHIPPEESGGMCFPKEKRADFSALIIRNILHDVPDFAGQNSAKHLNGMGTDALVPFQPRDLSGADIIPFDEHVLCDTLLFHDIP